MSSRFRGCRGGTLAKPQRNNKKDKTKSTDNTTKESTQQNEEELDYICIVCAEQIVDGTESGKGQDAVFCDGLCGGWFHARCAKLTAAEFKFLADTRTNIKWYCNQCDLLVEEMIQTGRDLDLTQINSKNKEQDDLIEKLSKRLESIETQMAEQNEKNRSYAEVTAKCTAQEVQQMVEQHYNKVTTEQPTTIRKAKIKDPTESRDRNIIIYNAIEGGGRFKEETKEFDKQIFMRITGICEVEIPDCSIERIIRLGKKIDGKNRPILVALSDVEHKKEIFRNLWKLRESDDNINTVTLSNDMTPEERQETKELIKQARDLQDEDPENWYRLRGPPWNREINRIKMTEEERSIEKRLREEAKTKEEEHGNSKFRVRGPAGQRKIVELKDGN